ncbi:hypothetical protein AB1Y20_003640 [Prymnesium parvum]|uniref:ShKT domain-containing protein n=1 Tax=Prymnesium parvum TaxID=97485 RepID=A0AB34J5A6_PRYPA
MSAALVLLLTTARSTQCADGDAHCALWAQRGECTSNPSMMLRTCPTSCGLCTPEVRRDAAPPRAAGGASSASDGLPDSLPRLSSVQCVADQQLCPEWAEFGECDSNALFAVLECPNTCGACRAMCGDRHSHCDGWAAQGECEKNPATMSKECPMSCGVCAAPPSDWERAYCVEANSTSCHDRALSATACDDVGFMRECPAACGLCSNLCVDHARECSIWAKEGRCDAANHLASMLQTCPSSCGLCNRLEQEYNDTPCVDEDECANWALAGHCDENSDFMLIKCPIACGVCHEPGHPNMEIARQLQENPNRKVPRTHEEL